MTWRRCQVLIDGLPGESLTKTAMRDALSEDELAELAARDPLGYGPWSREALRLAAIEDGINRLTAITMWLATDRKRKLELPEPVRRPGIRGRRRRKLTAEGKAYLAHLRANQGRLPPGYRFVRAR